MMVRPLLTVASLALALAVGSTGEARAAKAAARVSHVDGEAQILRSAAKHRAGKGYAAKAPWRALSRGASVRVGDAVRTRTKTRLELELRVFTPHQQERAAAHHEDCETEGGDPSHRRAIRHKM